MPAQKGVGLHKEPTESHAGEQLAESGEQRSVWWPKGRTCNLAAENSHLVPEQDDLDGQVGVVRPLKTKELQRPDEGEVQKRECHGPFSAAMSTAEETAGQRSG